jgi:ribosomal-protein-alanine N-acetyltransferase
MRSDAMRSDAMRSDAMNDGIAVRPASPPDLAAIESIQRSSPKASQWSPATYLNYDCRVALAGGRIAGFLVARRVADDEIEILNLAVAAPYQRKGVGRTLMKALMAQYTGCVFLEVRESNSEARCFYQSLGFRPAGRRSGYYEDPPENAVVMKFHSC